MPIIDYWQEKHPRKSGKGRLILYIFLFVMILFLMFKAETFVQGFTDIFFSSGSTEESSP